MFLLDDILFAPIKGLAAICQKAHDAAREELEQQERALLAELADLHQQLETGGITDAEFNTREGAVLDRLDAMQR